MVVTMIDRRTWRADRLVHADLPLPVAGRNRAHSALTTPRLPYPQEELRVRVLLLDPEEQMNFPP